VPNQFKGALPMLDSMSEKYLGPKLGLDKDLQNRLFTTDHVLEHDSLDSLHTCPINLRALLSSSHYDSSLSSKLLIMSFDLKSR
jgi:hypothetical protein